MNGRGQVTTLGLASPVSVNDCECDSVLGPPVTFMTFASGLPGADDLFYHPKKRTNFEHFKWKGLNTSTRSRSELNQYFTEHQVQ